MLFSPSVIVEKVERDFVRSNESFSGFPRSGGLWDECLRALKDPTLMNHIIFNNDVMEIPPVRTFLKASRSLEGGFTSYQKKALGAFWDFVFREVFFYGGQEDNAGVNVLGIRKGSRYINPPSEVLVGDIDDATGKILMPVPRRRLRMNLAKPRRVEVNPVPRIQHAGDRSIEDQRTDGRMTDRALGDQRTDDRRTDRAMEDQRLDDRRIDPKLEDERLEERRRNPHLEDERFEGRRTDRGMDDQRPEDRRIDPALEDERVKDLRRESRRRDDMDLENGRREDPVKRDPGFEDVRRETHGTEDHRHGSTRREEESPEEKLAREQRLKDQRFEEERLEAQRLEVQRLEEQRLEAQRNEARRVDDERLEDPEAAPRGKRRNP